MKRSYLPMAIAVLLSLCFAAQSAFAFSIGGWDFGSKSCDVQVKAEPPKDADSDKMFAQALEYESREKWCEAAELYVEIRRQAPISPIYRESLFNLIRVLHKNGDYDKAITEAKEFLFLYPARPEAEDVLFLVGICFYSDRGTPETEQNWTQKAQMVFSDYIKQYPEGKYVKEAKEMLENSFNELAMKEVNIARFYTERGKYVAGAIRAQQMIQRFRASAHVPEALSLLVNCFLALDRVKDVDAALKIMDKVYAASPWTAKAHKDYAEYKAKKAEKEKK
jgi:outer membrane protein assembly factor BamD